MPFSPDEIEIKEFVPTLRGYGREEVRAYLRSVSEDVRRLEEQLEAAKSLGQLNEPSNVVRTSLKASVEPNPTSQTTTNANAEPTEAAEFANTAASEPLATLATTALSSADIAIVVGLKEALMELTEALARLSTQGILGGSSTRASNPTEQQPEVTGHQVSRSDAPDAHGNEKKTASLAPNFASASKLEPLFVHTKPQQVANSGLMRASVEPWVGVDRRGPERPWKSSQTSQRANASHSHADLLPATHSVTPVVPPPIQARADGQTNQPQQNSSARDHQNQNLIRAFLDGALGLGRNAKCVTTGTSDLTPSEQTATDTQTEMDNVVAFKRAAS